MKKNTSTTLSIALATVGLISATHGAIITVSYTGYSHDGKASAPELNSSFNTGNVDDTATSLTLDSTHSANVANVDGQASGTTTFSTSISGNATSNLMLTSNLFTSATATDTDSTPNREFEHNANRFIGFTVDTTQVYSFAGDLVTRARASAFSTGYSYYGGGGTVSLKALPASPIFAVPNPGNFQDAAANTINFTTTNTATLTAGVTYQFDFTSNIYQGFAGTGTVTSNRGWNISITPVPEPGSAVFLLPMIGLLARRSRNRSMV